MNLGHARRAALQCAVFAALVHGGVALYEVLGRAWSPALLAAWTYAVAGLVIGTLCAPIVLLLAPRYGHQRSRRLAALWSVFPLVSFYAVAELNRVVITSHSIRSTYSVVASVVTLLVLVAAFVLATRWLARAPSAQRWAPSFDSPFATAGMVCFALALLALPLALSRSIERAPPRTAAAPADAPNVVIFVSDCLRADHVSIAGYHRPTTPTFDRIAREGLRFEDAHAAASWTLPSVVGLLTSSPPGIDVAPGGLSSRVLLTTLPETLGASGYATYAASNNPHLSSPFGIRGCFQEFDDGASPLLRALAPTEVGLVAGRVALPTDAQIVDATLAQLDGLEEPFFVYVHLMAGHAPYELPTGYEAPFPIVTVDEEVTSPAPGMVVDAVHRDNLVGRYDALVRHADDQFARIIASLEASGRLERTLLVYTADHGEEFGDHDHWTHGTSLHDETVHVPLAMRLPGRVAVGVRTELTSLLDLAPTILGLVDGPTAPTSFRGIDLMPHLATSSPSSRVVLSELGPSLRALITPEWKYVLDLSDGREWLFDRRADPRERLDVAAEHPVELSSLRAALTGYLEGGLPTLSPVDTAVDPELAAQLEALGYGHADDAAAN